jgi:PAS domain S-box-containing protein
VLADARVMAKMEQMFLSGVLLKPRCRSRGAWDCLCGIGGSGAVSQGFQQISSGRSQDAIIREFRHSAEAQAGAKGERARPTLRVAPQASPDLASVISTDELSRRPSRPPDHAAENRALVGLAQVLAASPDGILQKLADTALTLCRAHSAGLSLLEEEDQKRSFHWRAIAGRWAPHLGGGTPREFGPCGTVLDRNRALLFSHPERDFPYFGEVTPLLEEGLLIPFYIDGEAVGTIWVVVHDESRRFDAEDFRVLTNLATFAASAYQTFLAVSATIKARQELQKSALALQRFAAIVESSHDAIVSKDLNGVISSWNKGAEQLFGYSAYEVIGRPVTILIPPDRENEEPSILERIRRGEPIEHYETVRRRKDGSLVDISLSVSPVKDAEGRIVGASKIARDITERKRAQEQQALLLGEMRHRVKNLFAVTSGMVALSARAAQTPNDLAAAVQGRLSALTRAHELTRPGLIDSAGQAGQDTTLHALIQAILAPFAAPEGSNDPARLLINGSDVPIGANSITNFALILHELATNAAKYGALSSPTGRIRIDCSVEAGELHLIWTERGGPALSGAPEGDGFGGLLTRRIVTAQFGGKLSNDWRSEGLIVRLAVPVGSFVG